MKKFTLQLSASLFFFFMAAVVQAQLGSSQWTYSNPKPFGFTTNQLAYASDNVAVAVGEAGGIARTTDGGGTWAYFSFRAIGNDGNLKAPLFNDIQFVNSLLAFAVADDGIMIKSTDGGINWSTITTPFYAVTDPSYNKIYTVHFLNADTGYIGGEGDPVTNRATIYKTTDGGATWQADFTFPAPGFSWYTAGLYKVRFNANGVGYVGGANGLVWKCQNGVWSDYSVTPITVFSNVRAEDTVYYENWEGGIDTVVTTYDDNTFGLDQQNYRGIAIVSDTEVVVSTQNNGGLVRINTSGTTGRYLLLNNGSAYAQVYAPLGSPQMYNLVTRNGITIAGASSNGQLLMSSDKGFTWHGTDVYTPGTDEGDIGFYGVDISPANRFGLCGQAGIFADSLTSWRKPFVFTKKSIGPWGYAISTIGFADADHGIVAGSGGAMLRTDNSGNSWEDISNPTFNPWDGYTSVAYISPNTILASASNGQFYKSFDRGTSFDLLFNEPLGASLDAMHFINEDTGWMVANVRYPDNVNFIDTFHQFIYHTYDGGLSWDTSSTVFSYPTDYALRDQLKEIKFLNANIGYAAGDNAGMYKTTDGGLTWVKQILPAFAENKSVTSIAIVDANTAYASGNIDFNTGLGGLVMKTVNGGNTWTMCNTGLPQESARYLKILMYDALQGLVFGSSAVYSTNDGGASWLPYYAPVGFFKSFECAAFAPMAGCTTGICQKVFTGAGSNILKLDADVVLPVKLSALTGTGTTNGNQLFWTAFMQENVSWFEIQRSVDGVNFQKIGEKVYPERLGYQSYQWLDANINSGRYYYRIKAVESTGVYYYTNIVVIASKKAAQWNHQLSNSNLVLNNVKVERGAVTATIVNTAGQVVVARNWNQDGGAFNQSIPLPVSAKGIYMVKVENAGAITTFRIFVQ